MGKRLVLPHTTANKAAGFVVFLVPFAIPTFGVVAPSIPACVVATFAAIQEGHLIRTGHN
jgi:CDP-diacylglycerol--glycerol-3-phosphate 3-phosphatidyltransferase